MAQVTEQEDFSPGRTAAYGAGSVGAGMVFGFANAALPLYLGGYGFPNFAIGLLAQDRPPLGGLSQVVVGILSDRTRSPLGRRRPYILGGTPVTAVALLGLALHPPAWIMVPLLLLATTALAVAYGPYLALLKDRFAERQRGRVGGVQMFANMLGQFAVLYLASQWWEQQEALVFGATAAALIAGFAVTAMGVNERPALPGAEPGAQEVKAWGAAMVQYLGGLLQYREAAKYMVPTLLFWFSTGGIVPFLTRFSVEELHTDESTAFQLFMVAIGATALFTTPAGWLGDRLGKKAVLLAGLLGFGLAIGVGSQVQNVEQAVMAMAVAGVANGVCSALMFPLLADLVPGERAGEFTGWGTAAWELAQPLGAVLAGLASDLTGTLRTALLAAGAALLLAGLLLLPVRPGAVGREQ